ncbi:MAG: hypothetical protein IJ223_07010 [Clostridia bacterium]|nr:hypothetical protein [Clostridia bacterium]
MYNFSNEAKQRLLNGKITRAYMKVLQTDTEPEIILTEEDYLKDIKFEELRYVPNEGFIGGTVAKRVTGNLNNIDGSLNIQDREFELYFGVELQNGTVEYVNYGTYIVQKPEDDQVTDNTSFEALDYMVKLNEPWEDRVTYPCTLKDLFDDLVSQSGLSTKVNSFLNDDFIVENNQFETGTTMRDVLKAIAQISFNWARIDEDDEIVMDFTRKETVDEELTIDNYYELKKNNLYGPINVIVLRNSQVEGENVTIRDENSILEYGETEFVIEDNPFAYTQEKRTELIEAARYLFGFTYTPISMNMIGYIYLNCKDKIRVTNLQNETFDTYLFNHTIDYNGVMIDSMESPAMTKTQTKYQFLPQMIQAMKHTELVVDKANQKIESIVLEIGDRSQKTTTITQDIDGIESKVEDLEDLTRIAKGNQTVIINDAYPDEEILELHIYGNNRVFDYLYPDDELYPNNTLYPYGDSRIRFFNANEDRTIELNIMDVLRENEETRDELFIDSEGKVSLIRRINKNGLTKLTPEITILGELHFKLIEGNNTFSILNYNAPIEVKYAIKSTYTDIFATRVEMNSNISQTAEEINLEVRKKVDENEVISKINQSAEQITIEAAKIGLTATDVLNIISGNAINLTAKEITIASNNFNVDKDGNMSCTNANISGTITSSNATINGGKIDINTTRALGDRIIKVADNMGATTYIGTVNALIGATNIGDIDTGVYLQGGAAGQSMVSANVLRQTSQESQKKNFEKLEEGLNIVLDTDIYKFNYKTEEDGTKKSIGFVIGDNFKYPIEVTDASNKGVNLYSMVSVAYKAIQEQQKTIEQLQKQIEELKGEE